MFAWITQSGRIRIRIRMFSILSFDFVSLFCG